jgi:hypothetical protein
VAFQTSTVRQDSAIGIRKNKDMRLNDTSFGLDTANLLRMIMEKLDSDDSANYNQLSFWLDQAKQNWNLIDKHTSDLVRHKDLREMHANKKVRAELERLWAPVCKEIQI